MHPESRIVVHVDAKVDISPFERELHLSTACFARRRVSVTWGGYSMVNAVLALVEDALEHDFDYAVLLSEQDYPIRPARELLRHLECHRGDQFIDARHLTSRWPEVTVRYDRHWFPDLGTTRPRWYLQRIAQRALPRRRPPLGLDLYGGSVWWCLSRDALQHVKAYLEDQPRVARYFRSTSVPEEAVFQTVLMASRFAHKITDTITYARFDASISPLHPLIWTAANLDELTASGCFFARKFDELVDHEVLDQLDKFLEKTNRPH
jgi:hypothetical protein